MKIGDRIVYPMHGAGEISGIEENEVGGVVSSYYILKLPLGNLKLMLPVDKIDEMGLRDVIDKSELEKVAEILGNPAEEVHGSWNKRFHANLDRMKTGDILEVASIVRNLVRQNEKKKISSGETRLLEQARQILISELVYVFDKTPEEVSDWVYEQINSYVEPEKNSDDEKLEEH